MSRKTAFLSPGKTVLIVCEDSKSSPDYFAKLRMFLRLQPVRVEVCGKQCGSDPKSVVDYAVERKKKAIESPVEDGFDEVFCVIDIDIHPKKRLCDAIQMARDNQINLIISNPCFEYWYILHFEKTGKTYTNHHEPQKDFQEILRGIYKNKRYKYDKSGCVFFELLYPNTDIAIKNSKEILRSQHNGETDLSKCNPSTDVHQVVKRMQEMSNN